MPTRLDLEHLELDPADLGALTAHAIARVRAGEWSEDLARMLVQQVANFHGYDAVDPFMERVGRELGKQRPL